MVALFYIGFAIALIGYIGVLRAAFKTDAFWGLGSLFIAPITILFFLKHWSAAKNPFLLQLSGIAVIAVSLVFLEKTN
ncbi:hypothetical protein DelCs14_3244 [Delftia sp. Cs1-4]|nr:hypothetical protein DelCs14_3244 [Delftia sp. Cs1-4]